MLEDIAQQFSMHGTRMSSGEPVTQLQHALQTASLAEQAGVLSDNMMAA